MDYAETQEHLIAFQEGKTPALTRDASELVERFLLEADIAKDALRKAGFDDPRLTAHSMRHSAKTLALLGGASLQQAQALARHLNINTTLIYSHNIDRVNNAPEFAIEDLLKDL